MKRFSQEQIDAANSVDLVAYLQARGYQMKREGSQMRLVEHESLYIRGNEWFWFSQRRGGKTLSFLTQYEGVPFVQAVKTLIGEEPISDVPLPKAASKPKSPKKLLLPQPAPDNNAAFSYLKSRGIDPRVIKECIDAGSLYQSNMFWKRLEDGSFEPCPCPPQAVFVGKDPSGTSRYAATRACNGGGKHDAYGSDKAFAFSIPDSGSKALWVFESPIDALSHVTLCSYSARQYGTHRLALGGIAPVALERYLADHPEIRYVNLGLDADKQGREATESLIAFLGDRYKVYDHPPVYGKDYNDDLLTRQQQFKEKRRSAPQQER